MTRPRSAATLLLAALLAGPLPAQEPAPPASPAPADLPGFRSPPPEPPPALADLPTSEPPAWTRPLAPPSKERVAELRAALAERPRDRQPRNHLGWLLYQAGDWPALETAAREWQPYDPRNPQVYEYLGVALSRQGRATSARRVLGSIADVAPARPGILNRAGYLLLRDGQPDLAADLFGQAIELRPDRQNNYRGLALARWSRGDHAGALDALEAGLAQEYHERYFDVPGVLREEGASIVRSWLLAAPGDRQVILARAASLELDLETAEPPLRVTLHWETDATDVDLHVVDPIGSECYYSNRDTAAGLHLDDDLTQGLGPEVVRLSPASPLKVGTFSIGVKYFRAGPMGVSRGIVLVHRPPTGAAPAVEIVPFVLLAGEAGSESEIRRLTAVALRR